MIDLQQNPLRVVMYEGPGAQPLSDGRRLKILSALLGDGHAVTRLSQESELERNTNETTLVLGEFDGPSAAQAAGLSFCDISGLDAEAVSEKAAQVRSEAGTAVNEGWKPWFPVIDYSRCTNCMQCLSFCLFDVYGVDDDKLIQVQNQSNCKTDCPACSRVCPEAAILFPKYGKGPINGDVVREEDLQREAMKVDISALLGGDVYSSLRSRQKEARKRFSTERDESKALLERKRCLKKLQSDLDIPDEVLMTLPSAGEIEERARRAKEKMEKRMARSRSERDRQSQQPAPSEDEWGI